MALYVVCTMAINHCDSDIYFDSYSWSISQE